MNKIDQAPAGSTPVNQMMESVEAPVEAPPAAPAPPADDPVAKFEQRLADREKTIGRQGTELGELRKQIEELKAPKAPAAPAVDEQLGGILAQIEAGEIELKEGLGKALAFNSEITAKQVMAQLEARKEAEEVAKGQQRFMEKNADFVELRDSGALAELMKQDEFADEYTAYRVLKLQQEADAKIQAAKEEGAKLASGSAEAAKVLGRNGVQARVAATAPKTFTTPREAEAAMTDQLRAMRGAK